MRTPEHDIVKLTTKKFLANEFLINAKNAAKSVSNFTYMFSPFGKTSIDIICNSGEFFREMGISFFKVNMFFYGST